jgi:hypothetical protein
MISPSNPMAAPVVTYEYIFCLSLSDQLRPPTQWKAQGLLSGSSTPDTVGHRLRPKILDMTYSLQQQMARESYALY